MDKVIYTRVGIHSYIYYTTLDIFMGANPPCKECLINTMCIYAPSNNHIKQVLTIKACNRLDEFVENNYWFDKR